MNETLLIKGGRVVDPSADVDRPWDVLIENGRIRELGAIDVPADQVIDARGRVVAPGFVDMHVHLREPGGEAKETIASGAAAAVAGGYTAVACMPNTTPPLDNEAQMEFVTLQGQRAGLARVYPVGAITKGRAGESLAELGSMAQAGAVAFSDDGSTVRSAEIMRQALLYARMFDKPIIVHSEDPDLIGRGVMHAGRVSLLLGLPGKPSAAEDIINARDIALAELTGGTLHLAHISTRGSVAMVRRARAQGHSVTCEVTPHHLAFTDEAVRGFDTDFKMCPPLRAAEDVAALIEGVRDHTVDCIATDHAPHTQEEKDVEFSYAPDGVIGLESAFGVVYTRLVGEGVIPLPRLIALLATNPARILRLPLGSLRVGALADLVVLDLDTPYAIDRQRFYSKARNCPFHGRQVRGRVDLTLVGGRVVFDRAGGGIRPHGRPRSPEGLPLAAVLA